MRFKVILKQYKDPHHLVVQLSDGRTIRGPVIEFPRHLASGGTGKVQQGIKGLRFVPDAIDGEFN